MQTMLLDAGILLAFILYSVTAGFMSRKFASRGMNEYFLAGRSLKGWQAGLSMAATQYAADTPLLVTGLVATAGLFSLWRLWIYAIAFLFMGFLLGSCWRKAGVLTDAELTEFRYSGNAALFLRVVKAIHMGTVINCTILAMVLLAATRIAEPFLIWHEWLPASFINSLAGWLQSIQFNLSTLSDSDPAAWLRSADNLISILAILLFTTLYSTTGGLRSVVATDVVQITIALIATFLYAWEILQRTGGIQGLRPQIENLYGSAATESLFSFGPVQWDSAVWLFIGVLAVQWFAQVNADGTGYLAQRTMGCASNREAKSAAVIFTFTQVLLRSLLWLPIAIGLLILYPAAELPGIAGSSEEFRIFRESTFALGIRDYLPPGIRGLMLTGLLAALASTIDTHLNWGASYWTNDVYKRFVMEKGFRRLPSSRELVLVARLSNVLILVIALWIMKNLESIQSAWKLTLLFGCGLGPVLILRWIWHRINVWSEIAAGAGSLILSLFLLSRFPEADESRLMLIVTAATTALVLAVTFLTRPTAIEDLKKFYARVGPPGFWRPVARHAGDAPHRPLYLFRRFGLALVAASLTVFLLLVGAGSFLLGDASWVACLWIGLGLILIPVWWRLAFHSGEEPLERDSEMIR